MYLHISQYSVTFIHLVYSMYALTLKQFRQLFAFNMADVESPNAVAETPKEPDLEDKSGQDPGDSGSDADDLETIPDEKKKKPWSNS